MKYSHPSFTKRRKIMQKPTVIIIGAGIGSLGTAAGLATLWLEVKIVEKNRKAGSRRDHIIKEEHVFDTGPMLMPHIYAETFTSFGERKEDYLELKRVDPTNRIHFDDGLFLDLTSNLYFMGASTHLGSGLPTVQLSANLTTDRIARDYGLT